MGYPDILVGVVLHKPAVLEHLAVTLVDDIHAVLVAHREPVLIDHRFKVIQEVGTLFEQFRIYIVGLNGRKLPKITSFCPLKEQKV